jgi:hypothetical protein
MSDYIFIKTNSDGTTEQLNGQEFAVALDKWVDELPAEEKTVATKLHKEYLEKMSAGMVPDDARNDQWNDWFQRFKEENNIVFHGKTEE